MGKVLGAPCTQKPEYFNQSKFWLENCLNVWFNKCLRHQTVSIICYKLMSSVSPIMICLHRTIKCSFSSQLISLLLLGLGARGRCARKLAAQRSSLRFFPRHPLCEAPDKRAQVGKSHSIHHRDVFTELGPWICTGSETRFPSQMKHGGAK